MLARIAPFSLTPELDAGWLLAPTDLAEFGAQYWETEPYHLAGRDPAYYAPFFQVADLDALLQYARFSPTDVRVLREQQDFGTERYLDTEGNLNVNQLFRAFGQGYTLVVNGVDRFWHPAATLRQSLERTLSHGVTPNLYLSPGGPPGLAPHYDTHDVFVLQIAGEKRWSLHTPVVPTPLLASFQPVLDPETLSPPAHEVTLRAGDLLYVPRGWIHHAQTETFSLHATIGVYPTQWCDLLTAMVHTAAARDIRLRQALPPGFLDWPDRSAALAGGLRAMGEVLQETASLDEALASLEDQFIRRSPPPARGHFADLTQLDQLNPTTLVCRREDLRCRLLVTPAGVKLQFPGNTVAGPPKYRDAFAFIAAAEGAFSAADLPPALDLGRRVSVVKRLIRGGLLRLFGESG